MTRLSKASKILSIFKLFIYLTYFLLNSYFAFHVLISRLFETTLTDENAIAAPAIMGFNRNPVRGYNKPAAIGMPAAL